MDQANVGDATENRKTEDKDVVDTRIDMKSVDESNTEPMVHVPEVKDTAVVEYKSDSTGAGCKSDTTGAISKSNVEDIRFNTSLKEAEEQYCYFWKEHNPFSQWHASKFTIGDQEFCCAEQYMMYTKAVLQHDDDMAQKILKCDDPRKIKALGRKANQYSPDLWYNNCLHVVKDGNRAKFTQNEKLKESLLNTYPKILVEASPFDKRWGIGFNKHQESAWNEVTWDGLNLLGYILTELRDELLFEASIIPADDKKIYFDMLTKKLQDSLQNLDKETHASYHRYKHRADGRKHDGDFKHDRGQTDVVHNASTANIEPASTSPNALLKEPCIDSGSASKSAIDDLVGEGSAETSTKDDNTEDNRDNKTEDLKFV